MTAEQQKSEQLTLFDEKLLDEASVPDYKIIGQVFDTYWIVQFHDSMYIIDQHAAPRKILYERTLGDEDKRLYVPVYQPTDHFGSVYAGGGIVSPLSGPFHEDRV